jgi:NADH-quinone oxidoreductase subunit E
MTQQIANNLDLNDTIDMILDRNGRDRSGMIAILQDTQKTVGYLPREALTRIAEQLNVPISQVYAVATFYKAFKLKPCGKHIVKICLGTACHIRGGPDIMRQVESELGVKEEEVTPDGNFSFEAVRCVGCCGLAPVLMVDENFYGKVLPKQISKVLSQYKK